MKGKINLKIIGITGNSGSGKTLISKIINEKLENSVIIDADEISKELSKNINSKYYKEIVEQFGEEILIQETKQIDRKKLARIIFENEWERKKLNVITYKYVVSEIKNRINMHKENDIILDVPLLFEAKLDEICNITIAVIASKKTKINRICLRDNLSLEDASKRLNAQIKEEILVKKCNYTIENNGNIDNIEKQIDKILMYNY